MAQGNGASKGSPTPKGQGNYFFLAAFLTAFFAAFFGAAFLAAFFFAMVTFLTGKTRPRP